MLLEKLYHQIKKALDQIIECTKKENKKHQVKPAKVTNSASINNKKTTMNVATVTSGKMLVTKDPEARDPHKKHILPKKTKMQTDKSFSMLDIEDDQEDEIIGEKQIPDGPETAKYRPEYGKSANIKRQTTTYTRWSSKERNFAQNDDKN